MTWQPPNFPRGWGKPPPHTPSPIPFRHTYTPSPPPIAPSRQFPAPFPYPSTSCGSPTTRLPPPPVISCPKPTRPQLSSTGNPSHSYPSPFNPTQNYLYADNQLPADIQFDPFFPPLQENFFSEAGDGRSTAEIIANQSQDYVDEKLAEYQATIFQLQVTQSSSSLSESTSQPSVSTSVIKEEDIVDETGRSRGKLRTIKTVVVERKLVSKSKSEQHSASTSTSSVTVVADSAATVDETNVTSVSSSASETSSSVSAVAVTENVIEENVAQGFAMSSDSCLSTETFEDSLENANATEDATDESVVQCVIRDKEGNITTFKGGPDQVPAEYTVVQVMKMTKRTVVRSTVIHGSQSVASNSIFAAASTSAAITDSLSPKSDDDQETSASLSLSMDSIADSVEETSSISSGVVQLQGASTQSLLGSRSSANMCKTKVDDYISQCRGMCFFSLAF